MGGIGGNYSEAGIEGARKRGGGGMRRERGKRARQQWAGSARRAARRRRFSALGRRLAEGVWAGPETTEHLLITEKIQASGGIG
jgi:hypothetical protein